MARRSNSRVVAALVLLAGVLVLAFAGVIGAVVDDPPRKPSTTTVATSSSTTTTLVPLAQLGEAGVELEALIAAGRTVTYHAVYSVTDPDLPTELVQTLEIWRRGDSYRSDIIERQGNSVVRQSSVLTASSAVACETVNGEETCRVATSTPSDLPAAFVTALTAVEDPPELEVTEGDVAGFIARCFSFEGDEEGTEDDGELCLAEDGVMLSVRLRDASLVATTLEDNVPDAAFSKPGIVQTADDEE